MGNLVSSSGLSKVREISSDVIKTKYGKIVGRRLICEGERRVDAFLGIPFAKPPITPELRFKKPQPPEPWDGILSTTKFAKRCFQKDMLITLRLKLGSCSEDCLYLNVFTPSWSPPEGTKFPVMVFVHGGGYVSDSAIKYGDIGICRHLVAKNAVVVVTLQYRLSYFGFFTTGDDACDDNVALWDMTFALEWIQDNIGEFGGDKNNVTLFGQSAGGASVDLLSLSPYSRDLFHKVIPMAGSADCEWAINDNAMDKCRSITRQLGVTTEDTHEMVKRLQCVPAAKLALKLKFNSDGPATKFQTEIGPIIDGKFLPKSIPELREEAPKKKLLIGVCEHEGLLLQFFAKKVSLDRIKAIIADRIPESEYPDFQKLREEALRLYIDEKDFNNKKAIQLGLCKLFSDLFLGIGTQKSVLEQLRVHNDDTYLYSFDYHNPSSFGIFAYMLPFKAATHCTELAYLFEVGIINTFKFNESDNRMLDIMTKLWANFAKYGNPNGSDEVPESLVPPASRWIPASSENPSRHLSIKLEPDMQENFQENRPLFWLRLEKEFTKVANLEPKANV